MPKHYKPKNRTFSLFIVAIITIFGYALIYYLNNSYNPVLSDESIEKMKNLNNMYGFDLGEDLLGNNNSNTIASLLSNDVLESFGDSDNQGLIVQFDGESNDSLILMTPDSKISEEDLWIIAEEYSEKIPEIDFAEPDIELQVYSSGDVKPIKHNYFSNLLESALQNASRNNTTLRKAQTTNADNKWWLKKPKKNHSLRASLNFSNKGDRSPIAILDSGADINHSYYKNRIWDNVDEDGENKVDDDHNWYIDDLHGCNFTGVQCGNLEDAIGHGTHMVGIIAKYTKSPRPAKIAVLKVFDKKSESRLSYAIKAIKYATDNGMRVMNISFGTTMESRALKEATEYAYSRGAFMVAAAGNNASTKAHYPAAYEKVIAVGALNNEGGRLAESNYDNEGDRWIDVWALGERVLSTIPNERYGYLNGTSQAAPFVTAQVANILNENPNILIGELKLKLSEIDFTMMSGPSPYDE